MILLEVSYFARNIYETETVTSGLCYTEYLIFLKMIKFGFEIFWMSSQPIVQWNYVYIIVYFHIFRTSFWKRVHNSKEIINIQGLFILTVANVDMTTYPLTKYYYIIEKVYFIHRLFVLFISTF